MSLSQLGKVLDALGTMRKYNNGELTDFVWRWWNPLTWVCAPIILLVSIALVGVVEVWRDPHQLGLTVDPYFKKNGIPVDWIDKW